jgi:imidazolonepropionase-like amidohydrolase
MRKILVLFLFLFLSGLLSAQTTTIPPARPLAPTHVTVIDVTGAPSKPDMTLIVEGNRIVAVGKTGKVRVPPDAQVIDASGKFLIPGLWDMHVHMWHERWDAPSRTQADREVFLNLFVPNGITGVRDRAAI